MNMNKEELRDAVPGLYRNLYRSKNNEVSYMMVLVTPYSSTLPVVAVLLLESFCHAFFTRERELDLKYYGTSTSTFTIFFKFYCLKSILYTALYFRYRYGTVRVQLGIGLKAILSTGFLYGLLDTIMRYCPIYDRKENNGS
jgi:hypothetical protein